MRLNGKKIFITGGTGGIGKPLVKLLLDAGAIVDIYNRERQGDLVQNIDTICGKLALDTPDILINLAGYNDFGHCENQDAERLIALNLTAPIRLTQAVLPAMKQRGSGQIVNIGSMTALIPLPHLTCYVASKAGLKAFSDSLRREIDGTGIFVTHIAPRAVDTDANKGLKRILNQRTGVNHDNAEYVAERILRAITRHEKEVRIGGPERFFAILNALLPRLVDKGLKKNRDIGNNLLASYPSTQKKSDDERNNNMKKLAMLTLLLLASVPAQAQQQTQQGVVAQTAPSLEAIQPDPVLEQVSGLQTRWAEIKYHGTNNDTQISQMAALSVDAAALSAANPDRAEPKIWQAIILSSEAGLIKGISALPKVKAAKAILETVAQINPQAMQGSAYTSLGSLYYQVPGWPIGFGDNKKAEKYLLAALEINPDGIDPNYFYGDFLIHEKRYSDAIPVLEKALLAPDRPGRALADEGRRQEIRTALNTAKKEASTEKSKFN